MKARKHNKYWINKNIQQTWHLDVMYHDALGVLVKDGFIGCTNIFLLLCTCTTSSISIFSEVWGNNILLLVSLCLLWATILSSTGLSFSWAVFFLAVCGLLLGDLWSPDGVLWSPSVWLLVISTDTWCGSVWDDAFVGEWISVRYCVILLLHMQYGKQIQFVLQ